MKLKVFDELYILDSRGKVRVYNIQVITEPVDNTPTIHSSTGLLGGKMIGKIEPVKRGKQNRDVNAQALLQADSLWRCKLNEGYKSYKVLVEYNNNRNPPLKLIDNGAIISESPQMISEFLRCFPEASYTNENWDELPMLASKYKDQKKNIKFPVYIQPKYNGVRCLAKTVRDVRGNPTIKLVSRGGTYYYLPHIQNQLASIMICLSERNYIFDGELYKHGVALQDISGAARTEDQGMLIADNGWLEYHIYDIIDLNGLGLNQENRERILDTIRLMNYNNDLPHIKFVKSNIALDHTEIKENHDDYIEQGYEGAIVRLQDAKYEFNQRSKGLIKVKEFIDEEFEIVGFSVNNNKTIGESFVFILKNNLLGASNTFEARPTGTLAMKENWAKTSHELMGKKATVRFQERSKDGLPIQGHVRSDLTEVLHIRPQGE